MPEDPDSYSMSFGDHLEELRRRILWSLALPLPLWIVTTFLFGEQMIEWLHRPLGRVLQGHHLPSRLQALGPAEALGTSIKLGLVVAIVLSVPWIAWQAWLFVRPGLYRHERRFVHFLVPLSGVLTAVGVCLMYYVMLPLMLQVLVLFGSALGPDGPQTPRDPRVQAVLDSNPPIVLRLAPPAAPRVGEVWVSISDLQTLWVAVAAEEGRAGAAGATAEATARADTGADPEAPGKANRPVGGGSGVRLLSVPLPRGPLISQQFRLSSYVNFVLLLMLGIVIAFQMPLVVLLLGWMGIVSPADLRAKRRHALFICAIVAAVITPADALSMIMMLVPLYGLYELSIVLLRIAPPQAVAEGAVLARLRRRRGPSHKDDARTDQTAQPPQTNPPPRRRAPASHGQRPPPDEQGDRP
jgi:Sec-independent protein secretion pathway component TatC